MIVVDRKMVGNPGNARVYISAAQFLSRHFHSGRRFNQRWSSDENRPLLLNDDRLIRHRRHVRSARCARTHHRRKLGDFILGQHRLVVENPAEMILIRENPVLQR